MEVHKLKKHLSFTSLRKMLSNVLHSVNGVARQTSKITYSIHDVIMSTFACRFLKDSSLLQFQKRLDSLYHSNNLKTMFDVTMIPESTRLREIMDEVESEELMPVFKKYIQRLQRGKHLEQYQLLPGLYYCGLDGTEFYHSTSISCPHCLTAETGNKKPKKNKKTEVQTTDEADQPSSEDSSESHEEKSGCIHYSHKAVQAAIMHPDKKQVIPLMPEEIRNTDGTDKQDCETNAAKRLLPKIRKAFPKLGLIIGGDDLFSREPMIKEVLKNGMHFIFVAKPKSHTYMMDWLSANGPLMSHRIVDEKNHAVHQYQWKNEVPLYASEDVKVNFIHYQKIALDKHGHEIKVNYTNSWVTDLETAEHNIHALIEQGPAAAIVTENPPPVVADPGRVPILARGGRCRWKVENECFNTLKNQGYEIDHNFGHGQKNLSFNFYVLTIIAFAFHQILELTDTVYQGCRKHFGSKRHLYENLRATLRLFVFENWEKFLLFVLDPPSGSYVHGPQGPAPPA